MKTKTIIALCLILGITKMVNSQVKLQTGAIQADFPLYNLQDSKSGVGCNVTLSYTDGNGINVNEIASQVGTGWMLNVGGEISRTIVGQPDDQKYPGTLPTNDYTYQTVYPTNFGDGYMYSSYSPGDAIPGFASQHLLYPSGSYAGNLAPALKTNADRQQDIFTFSFNGRMGQFYIGKDKSVLLTESSKLQITFQEQDMSSQGIRTRINKFVITDENGFVYTFSELEARTIMINNVMSGVNSYTAYDGVPAQYLPKAVTKWLLTSIKNPFTTDEVDFTYSTFNVDIKGARHLMKTSSASNPTKYTMMRDRYLYAGKRISRINMPNYQSLVFTYNAADRVDLPGDNALTKIALVTTATGTDKLESSYQFKFGYFYQNQVLPFDYSFTTTQQSFARLCLQSVQKFAANETVNLPPTTFSYILSIPGTQAIVPAQFSLNKDLYGYYSISGAAASAAAVLDNTTLYNFGNVSDGHDNISTQYLYSSMGLLNKIVYPTGGSLTFNLEQNTAGNSLITGSAAPGVRVSSVLIDDGYNHVKQVNYKYVKTDNTSSGGSYEKPIMSAAQTMRVYKSTSSVVAFAINEVFHVAPLAYSFFSASEITFNASESLFIAIYDLVQYVIYALAPDYQDYTVSLTYFDNLNLTNPLPIYYSRVEVQEVAKVQESSAVSTNGKTVYEFTSYDDYPPIVTGFVNIPNSNVPLYTSQQRFAAWQYGLVKKVQYYDNAVNPVNPIKEVINNYTPYVSQYSNSSFLSATWAENISAYTPVGYNPLTVPGSYITSTTYYPYYGRMELTSSEDKTYDQNGNIFDKKSTYKYNATNYLVNNIETFNNGNSSEVTGKSIYYPCDYNSTVNYSGALLTKNIWNLPVTTADYKKNGASFLLTGASANIFTQLANGEIKTSQVYGFENTAPVANSFVSNFSPTTSPGSYAYLALKKSFIYNSSGAVIGEVANSQTHSFLTSYNGRYIIAKAFNCDYYNIAVTSFEDGNNNNGNWACDVTKITSSAAKTGGSSFQLSATSTVTSTQTLNSSATYIIELWLKTGSGSCTVNGSAVNQILNNTDGWTYCSINVSGITSVTIGGTGIIDEVRLYPKGSQVTSYTYDLIKGITTEEDVSGRILYTQYDGLGRTDVVYDQNKNILKKFNYNNAGQQTNYAGTVFYNSGQIGYFRGSCAANYINDLVAFPVAANTYKSIISQADADQQALDYIAANGQAYANSHPGCRLPANITITYNNSTNYYAHAVFTNKATNMTYDISLSPNMPANTVASGTIPQGIYDVKMYSSQTGTFTYRVMSNMMAAPGTYTFTNLDFSSANTTSISVGITL